MAGAYITIDDAEVKDALSALLRRIGNLEPVLEKVGEYLLGSHNERWGREEAPDGTPWKKPLSELLWRKTRRIWTRFWLRVGNCRRNR